MQINLNERKLRGTSKCIIGKNIYYFVYNSLENDMKIYKTFRIWLMNFQVKALTFVQQRLK